MELILLILFLAIVFGDGKPKKRKYRRRSWWQSPSYSEYDCWWHDNPANKSGWN